MNETFISVGLAVVHMCTSVYIFTFVACSLLAGSVSSFFHTNICSFIIYRVKLKTSVLHINSY